MLAGDLTVPGDASGIVVFAHGSGSSRHSRRNRQVAAVLQQAGLARLLMDLLTEEEEAFAALSERYGLELDFDRVPRLVATHGLVAAGDPRPARMTSPEV